MVKYNYKINTWYLPRDLTLFDIKWLTMGFFKREDFSRSSLIEAEGRISHLRMTEKRPRVLKNIFILSLFCIHN